MNTQDFLDWAFAQAPETPELKLVLVTLAFGAEPYGGGRMSLGALAARSQLEELEALGALAKLQQANLIVFKFSPSDRIVSYGLSIAGQSPA